MRLRVERLEDKLTPATLDLVGGVLTFTDSGTEANNLTVAVGAGVYSFNDSLTPIALGSGAIAAGYKGSGTSTISGPETGVDGLTFNLGGGSNTVNLRSTNDPTTINGQTGASTVYICSNAPSQTGDMSLIQASVTVNAGSATNLWASDYTGQSRPDPVHVTSSGITGLSPYAINLTGTLSNLRISGSNTSSLPETFIIDGAPCKQFALYTYGGVDDVQVNANVKGNIDLGAGDDLLTVLAGVTLTGNVQTGQGSDTVNYGGPTYGDITGLVI